MKSRFLFLLFIFSQLFAFGQNVRLQLKSYAAIKVKDGILVTGLDLTNSKVSVAKALLYDSSLKLIKEYSKEIPDPSYHGCYSYLEGETILLVIASKGHNADYYIRLDRNLNELSSEQMTKAQRTAFFRNDAYWLPALAPMLSKDDGVRHLGNDLLKIDFNDVGLVAVSTPVSSPLRMNGREDVQDADLVSNGYIARLSAAETKFQASYSVKWKTLLDEKYIGKASYVYYDEEITLALVTARVERKLTDSYLYCLDSKTGKVKYKKLIELPAANTGFYFTGGLVDVKEQKIILAGGIFGSAYKDNDDLKFKSLGILMFDMKGNLLLMNEQELLNPDVLGKKHERLGYDANFQLPYVRSISKNGSGYDIQVEMMVKRSASLATGPYRKWLPVAMSLYKLKSLSEKAALQSYVYNEDEVLDYKYLATMNNGEKALVSSYDKARHNVKVISFGDVSTEELIASYKSDPQFDIGTTEYLMDDHTLIIYNWNNNDECELTGLGL